MASLRRVLSWKFHRTVHWTIVNVKHVVKAAMLSIIWLENVRYENVSEETWNYQHYGEVLIYIFLLVSFLSCLHSDDIIILYK